MTILYIPQPNSWSCLGCAAAMAAGETLEDFVAYTGHDGSKIDEKSLHPEKRRGFFLQEAIGYLLSKNMFLGFTCVFEPFASFKNVKVVETSISLNETQAIISVKSSFAGCRHVIFWDGKRVYDPKDKDSVDIGSYDIVEFFPVHKISDER